MNMENLDDVFDGEDLGLGEVDVVEEIIDSPEIINDDIFADEPQNPTNSILDEFLKSKGLENNKITVLDENETETVVDFYDLTKEEQLDFLNSLEQKAEGNANELGDDEFDLINRLRTNNLTVNQFLENYKEQILKEANISTANDTESYDVDSFDDNELFLLDLKNKYELTDEELVKELEKELQDEVLFKKKVDKLRSEYKGLEDSYKEGQLQEALQEKESAYNQFVDTMVDVAIKTPEFYGIDLEDDEKNEVLSSILELDGQGLSEFHKSIQDPKELYRVAWFQKYGEEAFNVLKSAYETEIVRLKKDNPKPVIVQKSREIKNMYDLNF